MVSRPRQIQERLVEAGVESSALETKNDILLRYVYGEYFLGVAAVHSQYYIVHARCTLRCVCSCAREKMGLTECVSVHVGFGTFVCRVKGVHYGISCFL